VEVFKARPGCEYRDRRPWGLVVEVLPKHT
jgi:hypothetical protein